jgi:hypothetical protein
MGICGPTGAACTVAHISVCRAGSCIQALSRVPLTFHTSAGSLACALISAFGSIFLAVLAILIQNDYP